MQFLRWSFCLFADFLEGEITMLKFNSKDRVVTDATLAKQIAGKEKSEVLKQLDIGGLMVTIYRLITDIDFVIKIKEEFVLGGFRKMIIGEEIDLQEV